MVEQLQDQRELIDLSEDELEELANAMFEDDRLASGSSPKLKEKQDIMAFFNNVLDRADTSKVGNLSENELVSVRLMQRAALYALENDYILVARYIKKRAEIVLATSLSGREQGGFFLKLVTTMKRVLESTSRRGHNVDAQGRRGFFGLGKRRE